MMDSPVSGDAPANEIADLQKYDASLLRRRWRNIMGRPAPPHLSQNLVLRIVVWREQIVRGGDLDPATVATLDAVGEGLGSAPGVSSKGNGSSRLRSGTILVREHAGKLHRVTVLD